jgi:hypothetical protein
MPLFDRYGWCLGLKALTSERIAYLILHTHFHTDSLRDHTDLLFLPWPSDRAVPDRWPKLPAQAMSAARRRAMEAVIDIR